MDPLLMRFIERILAVLAGGLAIWLGYRLFSSVPAQNDGKGTFKLPLNTSIVVTKVGPGVFFALFGAVTLCVALFKPLEIETKDGSRVNYVTSVPAADKRADGRALLRREIATLNTIPGLLSPDLPPEERGDAARSLSRVKLLLLQPVWGEPAEGFGSFSEFESWVDKGEPGPPPAHMDAALALYRYGAKP